MKTFTQFVKEQPADRAINHECWDTCAVGDYSREAESDFSIFNWVSESSEEIRSKILGIPLIVYNQLHCSGPYQTYGDLAKAL